MELKEIGYFSKTHGIKGHLILKAGSEFYYEEVKAFFIDMSGSMAPYFISAISEVNNGLLVSLEGIDNVNKARELTGKKVFIDPEFIVEGGETEDWLGFELIDEKHGSLGKIHSVDDTGPQTLVSLLFKEREIILPLAEDLIESVDEENKRIFFRAPDGLIDIYL